jgi:hypothetical protein
MRNQKVSQVYLAIVPLWILIVAFAFRHISPSVYLPIWIIHGILMILAMRSLARQFLRSNDSLQTKYIACSSLLIITAWIFISIFFGFGPPPETIGMWIERSGEQQIRYAILILAGILITISYSILRGALEQTGENFYSRLGIIIISIAIPLYILNMAFWGGFLTSAFKSFISTPEKRPDWYDPLRALFGEISTVEVALIYLATGAFLVSFKKAGWINPSTVKIYLIVSLVAMFLDLIPGDSLIPLKFAGYFVSIPAIPFVIPYLMAIQLLINLHSYTKEKSS